MIRVSRVPRLVTHVFFTFCVSNSDLLLVTLVVEVLVDVLAAHRTAGRYRVVGLGPLPVRVSVFPVDCKQYAVG